MHTQIQLRPGISYAEMLDVEKVVCDIMYEQGIIEARGHGRNIFILDTTDEQHKVFEKDTFLTFWGKVVRRYEDYASIEE